MYSKSLLFSSCIIAILAASACNAASVDADKVAELAKCYKNFPSLMKEDSVFASEETQCFVDCILRFWGVVDANGVLNKEGLLKKVEKAFPEEAELPAIIEKCAAARGSSTCNTAALAYDCLEKNIKCTNKSNCLFDVVFSDTP